MFDFGHYRGGLQRAEKYPETVSWPVLDPDSILEFKAEGYVTAAALIAWRSRCSDAAFRVK